MKNWAIGCQKYDLKVNIKVHQVLNFFSAFCFQLVTSSFDFMWQENYQKYLLYSRVLLELTWAIKCIKITTVRFPSCIRLLVATNNVFKKTTKGRGNLVV